jgi:hypothetical protein
MSESTESEKICETTGEACDNEGGCCENEGGCCGGGGAANGVENAGVLDALGVDPATGEFVLVMFEPRPWSLGDIQLAQLQEKLNAYLSFALDGEMEEQLPQAAGKKLRITLACADEPPAEVTELLVKVRDQIALQGINFSVEGLRPPQESEGGCGSGCGCH